MITAAEARELARNPSPELACDAWLKQAEPWLEGEIRRSALAGYMALSIGYEVPADTWMYAEEWEQWLGARLPDYTITVKAGLSDKGPLEFNITLSWEE